MADVTALEAEWQRCRRAADRRRKDLLDAAEQAAWDALADAKHLADQCLAVGCRVETLDHSYCPAHRD